MSLVALRAELDAGHPDTGAYSANDATAANQINTVNRTRNRSSMTGSEVLNAVDATEWGTRSPAEKQTVWDIVHLGDVNPFGVEATLMTNAFSSAPGVTIAALQAARVLSVSRAQELNLGRVLTGTVAQARAL